MKTKALRTFALLFLGLLALNLQAQSVPAAVLGTIHADSLLKAMPDYQQAVAEGDTLKARLDAETVYNEQTFQRQFAEFLQGQKDFPESIMLKRQRDLQESMEKGIAFRQAAAQLLGEARRELEKPARERLKKAIEDVIYERNYEFIVDLDHPSGFYFAPYRAEDATAYVKAKLGL